MPTLSTPGSIVRTSTQNRRISHGYLHALYETKLRTTSPARRQYRGFLLATLVGTLACHDLSGLAGKQPLPAGTLDPNAFKTAAGAMTLYQTELAAFQYTNGSPTTEIGSTGSTTQQGAFVDYVLRSGHLADELQSPCLSSIPVSIYKPCIPINDPNHTGFDPENPLDTRQLPEGAGQPADPGIYVELQGLRSGAGLAIGALEAYAPDAPPALVGQMYALRGYAEIMLADLYCSGIPLSTIDFNGDFTYRAGDSTAQVYRDAITQFDTAIARSADSSRILNLARIGKGRAYLDLGFPDSAALAVVDVPDGVTYQFSVDWTGFSNSTIDVANVEGGNGLPYLTAGAVDPRVTAGQYGSNQYGSLLYAPIKYGTTTGSFAGTIAPITVADWIEARLIRAEAALAAGNVGEWYSQLHYLRQHGMAQAIPDTLVSDTLTDPGTEAGRVAMLFRERAYWLFLTGHRQGDMRRLIRQYNLSVYPTGAYPPGTGVTTYGTNVNLPIPQAEHNNPLFTGCFSRGA